MRLRKIDFKQLSTSIGAVVAFLSFFVTLFKGVYQERPLTLSCIVLLVFMLMLGLALESMKKQTRSRIINTILNQKFPITALAQYAVYVSHDIRNSKIVLSSEMATVYLFTNNDNLSSLMSLVQYDILGNVKNKYMSESKITATYSKEPSEAFNSLSIDIIDNLTDRRIPQCTITSTNTKEQTTSVYTIFVLMPLWVDIILALIAQLKFLTTNLCHLETKWFIFSTLLILPQK